jgi:hypothetical protein
MEVERLIETDEGLALLAKSYSGALYIINGKDAKLLTPNKQSQISYVSWDSKKARIIAEKHNKKFSGLRIDMSKL